MYLIKKISQMIHVIASIFVKEDEMSDLLKIYEDFAPKVNKEPGCILYLPKIDHQTDIVTQVQETNIVTVIEKWESMAAFKAHLSAPHVVDFRKNIKDIVKKVSIKVFKKCPGVAHFKNRPARGGHITPTSISHLSTQCYVIKITQNINSI